MPKGDIATIHAQPTKEITVHTKGASQQLQFTTTPSGLCLGKPNLQDFMMLVHMHVVGVGVWVQ